MYEISKAAPCPEKHPRLENAEEQLVTEWLLRRLGDTGDGKKAPRCGATGTKPPIGGHPQMVDLRIFREIPPKIPRN